MANYRLDFSGKQINNALSVVRTGQKSAIEGANNNTDCQLLYAIKQYVGDKLADYAISSTVDSNFAHTVELGIDTDAYQVTVKLRDKNDNELDSSAITLPKDDIISMSYDENTQKITYTTKGGDSTDVSLADLIRSSELETRLTTFDTEKIDPLESRATSLEGRMTTAEGAIDALKTALNPIVSNIEDLDTNKADKIDTYTKAETDTAIQTAINSAILTALNTAV